MSYQQNHHPQQQADNDDWRSDSFRTRVRNQIHQYLQVDNSGSEKAATWEQQLFSKSTDKNEYVNLASKLISKLQEYQQNSGNRNNPNNQQQHNQVQPPGHPQPQAQQIHQHHGVQQQQMGQRWMPQQPGAFQNQQNFQQQQRVQNQHVPSPQQQMNSGMAGPNAGGMPQNASMGSHGQGNMHQGAHPGNAQNPQIKRENDEEQQRFYKEKLRRLQRYIEPLNRMIARNETNQTVPRINDPATKVRAIILGQEIHDIQLLDKVEAFCKQMLVENQQQNDYTPKNNNNHPCQALLDVVIAHISKPNINHTLSRTFKPVLDKVRPDPAPYAINQKEENLPARKHTIPLILQGEVASLDKKFSVKLNDSCHNTKGDIHIVVELNDPTLPPVRPLYITIPADYPNISPIVENTDDNMEQHMVETLEEGTDFIQTQKLIFHERQYSLGSHVVTLTQVLSGWELSIRQAMARANIDFAQQKLKEYEETHIIEEEPQHIIA